MRLYRREIATCDLTTPSGLSALAELAAEMFLELRDTISMMLARNPAASVTPLVAWLSRRLDALPDAVREQIRSEGTRELLAVSHVLIAANGR